ncbi:MAG: MFS transporter [Sedimentisphaerales bacterium]|nr:MFS transporter [Sedimentisphaerales bacterium]
MDRAWPLYGAAFAMALSLSICWTAMPFVLHAMGGTEAHVGYAPAANSLGYMAALLLTGSFLGHLNVKRATRAATLLAVLATGAMVFAVLGVKAGTGIAHTMRIWTMIGAGGMGGAAMALYWPFLMSWVSANYEGVELNRRFGRYNGSWSGGALIGPLIGGWLVGADPLYPMVVGLVCLAVSFVMLGFARNHGDESACADAPENGATEAVPSVRVLGGYRWISRVALFCAWASHAIARSQFALLFTGFGYSEPQFGIFLTIFAVCNFLALVGAGRWAFWHFWFGPIVVAQAALAVALLMIVYGRTLAVFYPAAVILGLAFGFAYSSHLFYGASTSRKRSVSMAVHEIVISLGITVGAGTGGVLAKHVGTYAPYWFAIGTIGLGGLAQVVIYLVLRAGPLIRGRRSVRP